MVEVTSVKTKQKGTDELAAAIHIGGNAITMLVGEMSTHGGVRTIELLSQPVPFAVEVFRHHEISAESVERAVEILRHYAEVLREMGLNRPPLRIAAANILLEARNHDTLINRVEVALGWQATVLEDGEMTRLIHLGTKRLLSKRTALSAKNLVVCHVGPGNTRALYFDEHGFFLPDDEARRHPFSPT